MTDTGTTQNTQYTGQVTLPNDGQITDVSTPDDNGEQTIPQSAAVTAPPTPVSSPNAPSTGQAASPQATTAPGQPQAAPSTQGSLGKNLAKGTQQPPVNPMQAVKQRSTSKAGIFHDIAETLAGGPRYQYNVDAYGNMQKTKVPVSNAHLALAIAMEAISGAFTGMANGQGPGGGARAAGASFQQGQQQVQERTQLQQQQAKEDYARRAQVTETNARMFSNAKNLSNADADTVDKYIATYKDTADRWEKEYPGYVKEVVGYAGLKQYNVTQDNAIPYRRVARLDGNGKPVTDGYGNPQWDIDYLIIDPQFKATGFFTDTDHQASSEMGRPLPDMANSTPFGMAQTLNLKSQYASWNIAKNAFDDYDKTLNEAGNKGGSSTTNVVEKGALTVPKISDTNISNLADISSNKYYSIVKGVITPDNFNAIIRGMINQESAGGTKNGPSKAGAIGPMQLMPDTAAKYGVKDINDSGQNIDGGTHYFADLLAKYKDLTLSLAAYNAGPGRVDAAHGKIPQIAETQDYVKRIGDKVGLTQPAPKGSSFTRQSMADATKADPSFPAALEKFTGALGQTAQADGNISYSAAIKHLLSSKDPADQDAGRKMVNYLGGFENITARDNYITAQTEDNKAAIQTAAIGQRNENKQEADERASSITQSYLVAPDNFKIDPNIITMDAGTAKAWLQSAGVKVPNNFSALWEIGHYKAPASILPARTWQKGAPNEMDAQTGLSYIQQFINPGYDQKNYAPAQKVKIENVSGNAKNGASIQNAGVAAQHLNLLKQAGDELANGDIPAANNILNQLSKAVGKPNLTTYEALLPIVAQEVGKVAAGGTVPYEEAVSKAESAFGQKQSAKQRADAIAGVVGLMYGRIKAIDDNTYDVTQEHLSNVPSEATTQFQQYGYDTPWSQKTQQQQKPAASVTYKPNDASQYVKKSSDGRIGMNGQGQKFIIATGQPTQ